MGKAIVRKNYLRAAKTLTFAAGGSDNIVISGRFNTLNFSLRGAATTGGAGAIVGKGVLNAINRMQIISTKHGTVADLDGGDLYAISREFFGSPALNPFVIAAGPTANIGYEFTLPVSCDDDETLTIHVTWTGALVNMWSDLTAWPAILRVNAELLPNNPEEKWAWRKQIMGANGVIGAATQFSQPTIPQIAPGFDLCCAVAQTNTTAIGTYTDALDHVQLQQGVGNYIIDENAQLLKHIFNTIVPKANNAGWYAWKWYPFPHTAETQLNLTAAVATVVGSQICYGYVMKLGEHSGVAETIGPAPGGAENPPAAPPIVSQATVPEKRTSATQRFGGLINVPRRT